MAAVGAGGLAVAGLLGLQGPGQPTVALVPAAGGGTLSVQGVLP
jgi:hypothetical protein